MTSYVVGVSSEGGCTVTRRSMPFEKNRKVRVANMPRAARERVRILRGLQGWSWHLLSYWLKPRSGESFWFVFISLERRESRSDISYNRGSRICQGVLDMVTVRLAAERRFDLNYCTAPGRRLVEQFASGKSFCAYQIFDRQRHRLAQLPVPTATFQYLLLAYCTYLSPTVSIQLLPSVRNFNSSRSTIGD